MQAQIIKVEDFGDGLNTKMPREKLKPSEAFSVSNLRTIGGTLYPRKDNLLVATIGDGTKPVHSQAIFEKADGSRYHLVGCGKDVYSKRLVDNPWWNSAWSYRLDNGIVVSNTSLRAETDYVIWVKLDGSFDYTKAKENGEDLRFIKDGQELPYWIEKWGKIDATNSYIAVKVNIPASTSFVIDMYVGNTDAAIKSNPTGIFLVKDNFDTDPFATPARMSRENHEVIESSLSGEWDYVGGETTPIWNNTDRTITVTSTCNDWGNNLFVRAYFNVLPCNNLYIKIKTNMVSNSIGVLKSGSIRIGEYTIYVYDNSLRIYRELTKVAMGNIPITLVTGEWIILTIKWDKGELFAFIAKNTSENIIGQTSCLTPGITTAISQAGSRWLIDSRYAYAAVDDYVIASYNSLITISHLSALESQEADETYGIEHLSDGVTSIFTTEDPWVAVQMRNIEFVEKIIFANGTDVCRTWTGSEWDIWNSTHGLNVPVKCLAVHKGRLFAANGAGGEDSRLYYCNVNKYGLPLFDIPNPTDETLPRGWETDEPIISGGYDWTPNHEDFTGDGIEIIGIIPSMFDGLLVMKSDGMTLMYGDKPDNWGKKKLPYPFGCIAPRSLTKYEDTLFWVSKIGVHYMSGESGNASTFTFDNIKADSLSEQIEPDFLQIGKSGLLPSLVGGVWDNKYYLFIPSDIGKCFVLDWRRKSWWMDTIIPIMSTVTDDQDKTYFNVLYVGGKNGKLYKQEQAITIPVNNWQSGTIQPLPNWVVRIREIIISLVGNVTLTVTAITNESPITTPIPIPITTFGGLHHVRIGSCLQGNQFEIQLEGLTDKVEGIEMSVIPLRKV